MISTNPPFFHLPYHMCLWFELLTAGNATAFSCVTCGEMFCGQNRCGQRYRSHCSKCNLRECGKCSEKHFYDCPKCLKFDPHCLKCKGECKKGCDLCGFPVCDNHARKCDSCGVQTCGIHDFSVDVCSYCEKGFCPRCHDHGDVMYWCHGCEKRSCHTGNCEEFKWCDRAYGSFCSECYVEEEEDGDNGGPGLYAMNREIWEWKMNYLNYLERME